MARDYKLNKVQFDISNYTHLILGIPKIGKTTFVRDMIKELYGSPDKGLLIACGAELGYKAIDNLITDEAPDWEEFVEIVDDLVENKDDNEFELIAIDTIDELVEIVTPYVIKLSNLKNNKKVDTLNEAFGGWGNGHKKAVSLIKRQVARLKRAGYGLFFLGHTKIREIIEKDLEPYHMLTGTLDGRFERFFKGYVDQITIFTVDKIVEDGSLKGSTRWMYFRSDGFVDAGSRLPDVPMRLELGAKNYIEAFEHGVRSALGEKISSKKFEELKAQEEELRKNSGNAYVELEKAGDVDKVNELIEEITDVVSSLVTNDKKVVREQLQELQIDVRGYKEMVSVEDLKTILRVAREVKLEAEKDG